MRSSSSRPATTALNDAISYAASRGIKVVAVDQRVTAPQAYAATTDQVAYGRLGAAWLFKALGGKGNVVELRGTAGAPADSDRHAGFLKALKTYPGIKVVKSAYTGGSFSVAAGKQMRDILDSGLRVDGVWTSGTDFTVTNAFEAAGKPLVPIVGADTNEFLKQQLTLKGWRARRRHESRRDRRRRRGNGDPAAVGGLCAEVAEADPRGVGQRHRRGQRENPGELLAVGRADVQRAPPGQAVDDLHECAGPAAARGRSTRLTRAGPRSDRPARLARMTASAYSVLAFSGAQWVLLLVFIIPVLILWGYAIVSLVGRRDLGVGAKLLWLLGILVLPLIGSILYFMLRPAPQEQNRRAQARHKH